MIWHRYVIARERVWKQRLWLFIRFTPWMAATAWAAANLGLVDSRYACPSPDQEAKAAVVRLHMAVQGYMLEHRGRCPASLEVLVRDGFLTRSQPDPWGSPYAMSCHSAPTYAVEARSAGPDARLFSHDDIVTD